MTWMWIILAAVIYGFLHSFLASRSVKRRLEPILGRGYRLFFNFIAGITLIPLMALTLFLDDRILYQFSGIGMGILVSIQLAAALAALITLRQTDVWRFLGLKQIAQSDPLPSNTLYLSGTYRWVRHPLYFFSLIFLWASPVMTMNQAALYLIFSVYLWIGAIFEERKLLAQFGQPYRAYQKRVPMLIPWKVTLWFK